ncbi:MAG: 4Fe-4S dicluster domain-containing protein [Candidatus Woesearchaeota archaeon]
MHALKKEDFNNFVETLISGYEVIAPVRKDIVRFEVLKEGDGRAGKVVFENPLYPAKDFFLPLKEPFFHFKGACDNECSIEDCSDKKSAESAGKDEGDKVRAGEDCRGKSSRKRVFLMNRCDINGVHRNDLIMLEEPADPYYKEKRDNAILVEIPCTKLERCSCENIGHIDCYDLKLIDKGEGSGEYLVDAVTDKGRALVKDLHLPTAEIEMGEYKRSRIPDHGPKDIRGDNKAVWEQYGRECFSCSACTVVCPTCMCFTIDGYLELSCEEGHRYREWASCQLLEFTKVAGGHVFRKDRGARGRQRLMCKFQYFRDKFGHNRCVGCGRCNEACPAGIDIFEYYSKLR